MYNISKPDSFSIQDTHKEFERNMADLVTVFVEQVQGLYPFLSRAILISFFFSIRRFFHFPFNIFFYLFVLFFLPAKLPGNSLPDP